MAYTLTPEHRDAILRHIAQAEGQAGAEAILTAEPYPLGGGNRRATYHFATNLGAYAVSIERQVERKKGDRTIREIIHLNPEAHQLQHYLYSKGAPVSRPVGPLGILPADDQFPSGRQFQVTAFIPGKTYTGSNLPADPEGETPEREFGANTFTLEDITAYGRSLAQLHRLTKDYFREHSIEADSLSWRGREAGKLLNIARTAEETAYRERFRNDVPVSRAALDAADQLRQRADRVLDMNLEPGLAHSDPHIGNIIITPEGRAILVDLEWTGEGLPAKDLATALLNATVHFDDQGRTHFDEIRSKAFFDGYESVKKLSAEEKNQVMEWAEIGIQRRIALAQSRGHGPTQPSADLPGRMRDWKNFFHSTPTEQGRG